MTLEQLLQKEHDDIILDIYMELESRVVPATGYAHAYCRKINKLINAGELQTIPDKYRNVYLPTLSKMIFKEMSRRYANVLKREKTIIDVTPIEPNDGVDEDNPEMLANCRWCCEVFDRTELHQTDLGLLCDNCITAIRSRGEQVTVYD
jgi:hypothetical protein